MIPTIIHFHLKVEWQTLCSGSASRVYRTGFELDRDLIKLTKEFKSTVFEVTGTQGNGTELRFEGVLPSNETSLLGLDGRYLVRDGYDLGWFDRTRDGWSFFHAEMSPGNVTLPNSFPM